jgi:hypothetical protein
MNSDKQSKSCTTGSVYLAKARPAWKTWRDQDITKPQFKLKKVWTVRKTRNYGNDGNNIRRGAIRMNKGNRSLSMNNSFLTQ